MYNIFNPAKKRKAKEPLKASPDQLKYPTAIFFIISNEFCERFSFYGMRTVLSLYLRYIGYTEDQATMIYHSFIIMCYFTPLLGAIIADSWLGRFSTILYLSIWYAIGQVIMSVGSIHSINLNPTILCMTALVIIGSGTGGIKPCVSAFGGDQFTLPEQEKQLDIFFSVFYFAINGGSFISTFLTPILRQKVSCFHSEFCYPLAFGVPAALMIVAVVVFVSGKPLYKIFPHSEGNVALDVIMCTSHAVVRRCKGKDSKKDNFLDYANDKYPQKLLDDVKQVGRVAIIFSPTIIFWALFEQQGSRWTFQATRMNGDVHGYVVPPDQMQILNSCLILVFIPLFQLVVYPTCAKMKMIRTPLQRMIVGGFLAALAFVISGIIELIIENNDPVLPTSGLCHLKLYNTLECPITISSNELEINEDVSAYNAIIFQKLNAPSLANHTLDMKYGAGCQDSPQKFNISLDSKKVITYMITRDTKGVPQLLPMNITKGQDIERTKDGKPVVKAVYGKPENVDVDLKCTATHSLAITNHQSVEQSVKSYSKCSVIINETESSDTVYLKGGGVYILLITDVEDVSFQLITITQPTKLSILWQIPQYILMTMAEIMVSITGLQLGFTQAPLSMRSVVSAMWLLTNSFGSSIVIIVASLRMFSKQSYEFFLFAGMMALDMCIFIIVAMRYTYIKTQSRESLRSGD